MDADDPNDLPDALSPGTELREYTIRRVLGQGGFAITYLAHDKLFEREVAIKEFLPTDIARRAGARDVMPRATKFREGFDWGLDAFLKEAQLLDKLDQRNVVRVRSFFRENATAYLVMEYVPGPTLAAWLAGHPPLDTAQLRSLLLPLMLGLDHVHASNCLHRDIKPENIVLRDGQLEQPVLIDFGAARKAVGERTRSVSAIVSAGYTPLEQYSANRTLSPASDIYAICAVGYRCITGEDPPSATDRAIDDSAQVLAQTQATRHPMPLLQALDAGLAIRAEGRPADTTALRLALGEAPAPRLPAAPPAETTGSRQAARDRNTATMMRPYLSDETAAAPAPASIRTQPGSAMPTAAAPAARRKPVMLRAVAAVVLLCLAGGGAAYFLTRGDSGGGSIISGSALDGELARTGRLLVSGDEARREAIRAIQREIGIEADGKASERVTDWLKDKPSRWAYAVAQDGSGDFKTVGAAVAHLDRVFDLAGTAVKRQAEAAPGPVFTLALRPGQYSESLKLRGPVRLQGEGPAATIVIAAAAKDKPVIDAAGRSGYSAQPALQGLSLRGGSEADALKLADDNGSARIEDNEIASSGTRCGIGLSGEGKNAAGARSLIGGNRFGGGCGVSASGASRLLVTNNAFSGLSGPALRLQGTADAEFRDNTFRQVGERLLFASDTSKALVSGGFWTATNPKQPALDIADEAALTIRNANLKGPDIHCVNLGSAKASLLIENSRFGDCGGPQNAAVHIAAGGQATIRATVFGAVAGRGQQVSDYIDAKPGEKLTLEGNTVQP